MDEERSTRELIEILSDDCLKCHALFIASKDKASALKDTHSEESSFHARQFIRAVFAYVEALTFSVKAWCAYECMKNRIAITPAERYFATDTEYEISEKGEIVQTVAKISLARNVRFAIAMNRKTHGVSEPFNASTAWWSDFRAAIKIRDRLTHPKMPDDLDLSIAEINKVLDAKRGFEKELHDVGRSRRLSRTL